MLEPMNEISRVGLTVAKAATLEMAPVEALAG
jgi:hypothetical protein